MTDQLWVVEMFNTETGWWEPTVGVALTKSEANELLAIWRRDNPSDKFRVRPYEAVRHDRNTRRTAMEGTDQSPKTLRIVDGWTFQDLVTGLTLTVRCGLRLDVLSISGSKDFPGQRDFFFTKLGDFDGAGAAVGECPRHD